MHQARCVIDDEWEFQRSLLSFLKITCEIRSVHVNFNRWEFEDSKTQCLKEESNSG